MRDGVVYIFISLCLLGGLFVASRGQGPDREPTVAVSGRERILGWIEWDRETVKVDPFLFIDGDKFIDTGIHYSIEKRRFESTPLDAWLAGEIKKHKSYAIVSQGRSVATFHAEQITTNFYHSALISVHGRIQNPDGTPFKKEALLGAIAISPAPPAGQEKDGQFSEEMKEQYPPETLRKNALEIFQKVVKQEEENNPDAFRGELKRETPEFKFFAAESWGDPVIIYVIDQKFIRPPKTSLQEPELFWVQQFAIVQYEDGRPRFEKDRHVRFIEYDKQNSFVSNVQIFDLDGDGQREILVTLTGYDMTSFEIYKRNRSDGRVERVFKGGVIDYSC